MNLTLEALRKLFPKLPCTSFITRIKDAREVVKLGINSSAADQPKCQAPGTCSTEEGCFLGAFLATLKPLSRLFFQAEAQRRRSQRPPQIKHASVVPIVPVVAQTAVSIVLQTSATVISQPAVPTASQISVTAVSQPAVSTVSQTPFPVAAQSPDANLPPNPALVDQRFEWGHIRKNPHGADDRGNPLGSLVYTNGFIAGKEYTQVIEWHKPSSAETSSALGSTIPIVRMP
ncbi:hypothetical protein M422DRAFT_276933 [Sphaerobolus stellatus SS14]|uniref:Unplaced genomic scaffold SPHSTscaffold_995, whole genome shotgun sequence n=1 Tax=Sphaerobolus stellatus (strain SS14) TaxID=990650 RepID=A0A0C9U0U4_SPHS4|nr:hypothetical protein M422DRAFT_276933 [Sphaerobolus stellatus SS14]